MQQCFGDRLSRDTAYHNGTIWPWLLGPFITAYLKVNDYSGDSLGTGGNVYAYNVTNGHLIFDYTSGSFGYNGYWINILTGIGEEAAGNLYTYGSEHSPGPNLEPGELLGAINATTGQPVWNITFWANGVKVADNYAVALNNYDGQIYAFSKGPTQTTVQTPLAGVTMGQPLSGTRHNNGHFAWH